MHDHDPFELAEGTESLDEMIAGAPPKKKKKRTGGAADVKVNWDKVCVRMDRDIKRKIKAAAKSLNVPIEELVHVALIRFLDGFDPDDFEPRTSPTRMTLLDVRAD